MSNVGFRIFKEIPRIERKEVIEEFRQIPTSNIADMMGRFASIGGEIRAFHNQGLLMAGQAFTVRVSPADNLMMHMALELAQPGQVVIVEAGGDVTNAITGEIMCTYAKQKGIEGFIIDGAIRDRAGILALDFPVYAKGLQPRGPHKDGPGEVNVPISCNGVVIHPGDIVIGDDDGVVVIPLEEAEGVLIKAKEKVEQERKMMESIYAGTLDQSWVYKKMEEKGCDIYDKYPSRRIGELR
ncbi:RraA family protein [Neobacillus niacini]|uniref:RraA family protein n=1 Tax=Neobacillus niacini TaxID=86668 RepID=UPI002783E462|nr:RraA family protein [Neobacillus niacini]MDQ1002198.1 RraA family protein [Neobacillus niacini]